MILLAQAAVVSIPVPVFAILGAGASGVFGFFVLRYIAQIDKKQEVCDERSIGQAEKLATLEARIDALAGRFDGSRKTDEILSVLLDHVIHPSKPEHHEKTE